MLAGSLLTDMLTTRNKSLSGGHRENGELHGGSRGVENLLDLGCALKAEPTGFPAGLDVGCEGKRGGTDDIKVFGLGSWKSSWASPWWTLSGFNCLLGLTCG